MTDYRNKKHTAQLDVEEFHRALDIPIGDSPAIRRPELRADLIMEEAREAVEAMTGREVRVNIEWDGVTTNPDLVEAIDGLVDLLVVTYGTAVEFGINISPFWNEVHKTNMAKQGGEKRKDGKQLKPKNWKAPDIAGILGTMK